MKIEGRERRREKKSDAPTFDVIVGVPQKFLKPILGARSIRNISKYNKMVLKSLPICILHQGLSICMSILKQCIVGCSSLFNLKKVVFFF